MNPVWFILSIILLPLTTVQAVTYKKPGETVFLIPGFVTPPITRITWKHNSNLAAEWNGGDVNFHQDFKGRSTLNTKTGELTISNLTLKDLGRYTAEINGDSIKTTKLGVILPVPKPTISMSCDDEKTHCVLTCEGNTTAAGRISYAWVLGDEVGFRQTKEINITKEDTGSTISCAVGNQVGLQVSDQINNPIINNP